MVYSEQTIINSIKEQLNCNDAKAIVVYNMAWEAGHSDGMSEVYWWACELCDMLVNYNRAG